MRRLIFAGLLAVLGVTLGPVVWAQVIQSQVPTRDARVTPTGAAEISGIVVTDEADPQPVRRAQVRAIADGGIPRTAFTDTAGRFVFPNLPSGRYTIEASKPGFVRTAYGARRYNRPGTPVTLNDTQRTQQVELRMPRGAVITGRVTDEFGQPLPGARVRAQAVRMVNGERRLESVSMLGALLGEPADDRGVYRLYGLPAGTTSSLPRRGTLAGVTFAR